MTLPGNGVAGWLVAAAALVLVGVGQCRARDAGAREAIARRERDEARRDAAVWQDSAKSRQTRYVTDTVRLTAVRRRTDTLLVSITDTLIHRDTVVRIVERERAACDSVIRTCEARVSAADSISAALRRQLSAEIRLRDVGRCRLAFRIPCPSRPLVFGAGVVLGAAGVSALRR